MKTVRLATIEDLPRLYKILEDAKAFMKSQNNDQWGEHYPPLDSFNFYIEGKELYVLEEDALVVGMVALVDHQDEAYKSMPWSVEGTELVIHRLAIAEEAYGKGYGKYLLSYAIEVAREREVAIIKLDTYSKNKVAQRLFLSMGFNYVGDIHLPQSVLEYHCYEMVL